MYTWKRRQIKSITRYPELYPGCQRFSKRRAAKRWEEKRERRRENLWLPATVEWSYCANKFELVSRSDPTSWLEEPYSIYSDWLVLTDRCVVIGCLLIDSRDTYRSMIVRFASPTTRGFLLLFLSLSCLLPLQWKKPLGPGYLIYELKPGNIFYQLIRYKFIWNICKNYKW